MPVSSADDVIRLVEEYLICVVISSCTILLANWNTFAMAICLAVSEISVFTRAPILGGWQCSLRPLMKLLPCCFTVAQHHMVLVLTVHAQGIVYSDLVFNWL